VRIEPDRMAAWRAFLTAHRRVLDRIEADLAAADRIPLTWYDVLVELHEAPDGRLRLGELARAVVLSHSGVTRLVDRLAGAGLLERQPDPTDRRGHFAAITAAGEQALAHAWPVYGRGIDDYFAGRLDDAQAAAIRDGLGAVLEALGP